MSTIGNFKQQGENFVGAVQTLTLKARMTLQAIERTSEDAPDYRINSGSTELGAAWKREAKQSGRMYLSVTLDDPSFVAPIYARLVSSETPGEYDLIWSRVRRG